MYKHKDSVEIYGHHFIHWCFLFFLPILLFHNKIDRFLMDHFERLHSHVSYVPYSSFHQTIWLIARIDWFYFLLLDSCVDFPFFPRHFCAFNNLDANTNTDQSESQCKNSRQKHRITTRHLHSWCENSLRVSQKFPKPLEMLLQFEQVFSINHTMTITHHLPYRTKTTAAKWIDSLINEKI